MLDRVVLEEDIYARKSVGSAALIFFKIQLGKPAFKYEHAPVFQSHVTKTVAVTRHFNIFVLYVRSEFPNKLPNIKIKLRWV